MWVLYLQGKRKLVEGQDFNNNARSGNRKKLWAHKIRRKYLRLFQAFRKCRMVEAKRIPSKKIIEHHPVTVQWLMRWNLGSRGTMSKRLPKPFCRVHLPAVDTVMVLETESGERYEIKYLPRGRWLSAGWSSFTRIMNLEEGDAVVFQLDEVTKFKVYFIRENSANEVYLPLHIFNLVNHVKKRVSSKADNNQLSNYRRGEVHQSYMQGKQRDLRTDQIWRKDLRIFQLGQALQKCHLVNGDERLPSKLIHEPPVTVKWLMKSHVSGHFTMQLPAPFSRAHLPLENTIMVLETETGEQYNINYLAQDKWRLGSGWKRFVIDKKLEEGDAVVFHLVEAIKFKVYVVRANANEVNLPVHLLKLLSHADLSVSCKVDSKQIIVYRRQEKHHIAGNCNWKSARLKSRNAEDSKLLREGILFSNITSFEEFKEVMHELIQNRELPYYILHEYYELCCNQNAILHAHLFRGINPRLNYQIIVGAIRSIIIDTVNLANDLSTCKLSTFLHKYTSWDKALKTYEALGMNVSFLCARLHHLKNLAVSSEGATYLSRYEEACRERGRAKGQARKLELILAKLQTLKSKSFEEKHRYVEAERSNLEFLIADFGKFFSQYDAHIETLKLKAKIHELKFQEEVTAPWLH